MIAYHPMPVQQELDRLRDLHARLLQNDKLATIGMVASGVIHELVQPLSTLLFLAADSRNQLPEYSPVRKNLEEMSLHLGRVKEIVDTMRVFSRKSSLTSRFDMNEAVRRAVDIVRYQFRTESVALELECTPDPFWVQGHYIQAQQMVINLLTNARDAVVGARDVDHRRIRLRVSQRNGQVDVTVSDNGGGISPVDRPRLFEPFFTTKSPDRGTGLGLAITRQIAEAMGGTVRCRSLFGLGTTFRIQLPVSAPAEDVASEPVASARPALAGVARPRAA